MEKIENVITAEDFVARMKAGDHNYIAFCDKDSYLLAFAHTHTIESVEIGPFSILNLVRHSKDTIIWEKSGVVKSKLPCRPDYLKIVLDTNFVTGDNPDIPVGLTPIDHRYQYVSGKAAAPVQIS